MNCSLKCILKIMLILTFQQILSHLDSNTLPKDYHLELPLTIKYNDFFDILPRFNSFDELNYFISLITLAPGISVKSNHNTYHIQSLGDFFELYSRNDNHFSYYDESNWRAILSLIENAIFSKKNIMGILKNTHPFALEYHYLPCKGLAKEDLLDVVNDPDSYSKISPNLLPYLYAYFNPIRTFKSSPTPLLEMEYMARRAGHVFGLSRDIPLQIEDVSYRFKTQYQYAAPGLEYLSEFLNAYTQEKPSPAFLAITEAIDFAKAWLVPHGNFYKIGASFAFFECYRNNKLTYFTVGWEGHSVGVALYGDHLIYSNRGIGGDPKSGCKIYKLKDNNLITLDRIDKLINSTFIKAEDFHDFLKQIIDFNNPVASFPCKKQKYDTCSFVNPKNAVEAMIVLYQAGSFAKDEDVRTQFLFESDRKKFKNFTSFIRDYETDNLLKMMLNEKDADLLRFYCALAKIIITEHHGQKGTTDKDWEEFDRACYFYDHIPSKLKFWMSCDIDFEEVVDEIKYWRQDEADKENEKLFASEPIRLQFSNLGLKATEVEQAPQPMETMDQHITYASITS